MPCTMPGTLPSRCMLNVLNAAGRLSLALVLLWLDNGERTAQRHGDQRCFAGRTVRKDIHALLASILLVAF